jgi:tetratricopeptide (TPR) repeat protein
MRATLKLVLAGCLLLPALPRAAQAQQQTAMRPMYELPTITVTAVAESDPLYERATALYEQARWKDAAVLHREAAESMAPNDPNAYLQYDRSARLYFYAGDYTTSRQMMERAAEIAEAAGDMVSAAYRHIDAGFISVWEGYPGKRREHVALAEQYARDNDFARDDSDHVFALTRGVGLLPVEDKKD